MEGKKHIPAIRFKGFNDEWEEKKLGEIGETYTGLSGKTKDDFGHGNAKFITYMNVYLNSVAKMNMVEQVEPDTKQNEVAFGDIFFTTSSETPDEVGMSCVLNEDMKDTYLNSFCFGFRPKMKNDNYYMAYMLRSKHIREKIVILAQGISRYNISKNKLIEIQIPIPSLSEQQRIGSFFEKIDKLISGEQAKLKKLKNIKTSLLNKMFPAKGEKKPAIRFKGFKDEWEEKNVDNICSITTGKSNTQDQVEDGMYPFYIRSDKPVRSNRFLYDCEAIITIGDGNIGKVFHYVRGKFDLHQRCYMMTNFHEVIGIYFYYFFSTMFYKRAIRMSAKATVDSVRLEMIADMKIQYPELLPEQQRIGSFFEKIDKLISGEQAKLEKLKNIKTSLLNKMFPAKGEKKPAIRFKGFKDEWEEKKLGENKILVGGDVPKNNYSEIRTEKCTVPIYSNGIGERALYGYTSQYLVSDDSITISARGTIGHVTLRKEPYFPIVRLICVIPNDDILASFLAYCVRKEHFIVSGAGILQLTVPMIKDVKVQFPTLSEQQRIGSFFEKIDKLISLQEQKIAKLQNIKKAFLAKMFA